MAVEPSIIQLPKIADPRGNLTFIEGTRHVPFDIVRVFYTYDVPGGEVRAGHAHRTLHEFVIAVSGSFTVVLRNGLSRTEYFLNRSYFGLHIPPMFWREIEDFSSGSVCLVLTSDYYEEADYIRDYDEYLRVWTG